MSPLALLKEGETAEIVEHNAGRGYEHKNKQEHEHGHTRFPSPDHRPCCGKCDDCTCRNSPAGQASDRLMNMGLRPGKFIEMITNNKTGPLILKLDESRIALSRGMAMKIYVRRNDQ